MKRVLSVLLTLCLLMGASSALAANAINIAINGQDGFDSYVESLIVWDGRLLMPSYNGMYAWSPEGGLVKVEGYDELSNALTDENGKLILDTDIEDGYAYMDAAIYAVDDKLYRLATVSQEDENEAFMVEIKIAEDGTLSLGESVRLDDDMFVEMGDNYLFPRRLDSAVGFDGMIYGTSYGAEGLELLSIDLKDGDVETMELDVDGEITGMSRFVDGKLLIITEDYEQDPMVTQLLSFDLESEETDVLGDMPTANYRSPSGISYDEARGQVYYALAGSVWRMPVTEDGMGEPEEFGDMPFPDYGVDTAAVMDSYYVMASYPGVIARNVTLEKLPERRLRVAAMGFGEAMGKAYFDFTEQHPEFLVTRGVDVDTDKILSDMMNRSSDIDIFSLSSTDEVFQSLMNRGFMAELTESGKITQAVSTMYPVIQNAASKDGVLYALPMATYMSGLEFNKALFTGKLGYTEEDIPTTWPELFQVLAELPEKMEEYPELTLFQQGMYIRDEARASLFMAMLDDFFLWLDQDEANVQRSGEVLTALCKAFEAIDWDGMGMPEEYEEENEMYTMFDNADENTLLNMQGPSLQKYSNTEQFAPLMLAVAEGEKPMFGMEVYFAFVNPFSQNRAEAIEYLEYAMDHTEESVFMAMDPTRSEPIESPYYEEGLKNMVKYVEDMEARLEKTEDEEKREKLMSSIDSQKEFIEEFKETGRYLVSPENIADYRAVDSAFAVKKSSFWTEDTDTIFQYLDGAMSAEQLAGAMEKTMQMKRLEGN